MTTVNEPFLKSRHSVNRTRRSLSDGMLPEVPNFASIYASLKSHLDASALHTMPQGL